jgi:hypothetical protein
MRGNIAAIFAANREFLLQQRERKRQEKHAG